MDLHLLSRLLTNTQRWCVGLIVVAITGLWLWPLSGAEQDRFKITTTMQILAGVAGAFGLYVAWRRSEAHLKQAETAAQGLTTERFSRAAEQLGDVSRLAVRLSGIYSLGQIARKRPARYHWPVMEVLCAYVRENCPLEEPLKPAEGNNGEPLSADIQAILTVLGQRKVKWDRGGLLLWKVDLRGADLMDADLSGVNLSGSKLNGANLDHANLTGTHLGGADLSYVTEARGADFKDAKFLGTYLHHADLRGATNLTQEQIDSAHRDPQTLLPDLKND